MIAGFLADFKGQIPTSGGRPKTDKVKWIEQLILEDLDNDSICERTGESAANVRQIRSRMNRET